MGMIDVNDVLFGLGFVSGVVGAWWVGSWAGAAIMVGSVVMAFGLLRQLR